MDVKFSCFFIRHLLNINFFCFLFMNYWVFEDVVQVNEVLREDVGQWTVTLLLQIKVHKAARGASFLKLCVMSLSVIRGKLWRVEDEMVCKVGNLRRDTKQTRRQQLRTSRFVFSDLQVKKTLCATFELWIKEWYHSDIELSSERRIDR